MTVFNPHQISLTYVRDGKTDVLTLTTDSAFKIGVAVNPYTDRLLPVIRKEYGFFESFPAGVALGVKTLKGYVGNMKYLFSKEGAKHWAVSEPSEASSLQPGIGISSGI